MGLLTFTLILSIAITTVAEWFNYQCINFNDLNNDKAQHFKEQIKNDINLSDQDLLELCKASYFVGIVLELASLVLIYYKLRNICYGRESASAVIPQDANIAHELDLVHQTASNSGDTQTVISGLTSIHSEGDLSFRSGISLSSSDISDASNAV